MKINNNDKPREFIVGEKNDIIIKDCGRIILEDDEQVTFLTSSGAEYDVAKKDWGFYATPSLNGRLTSFGLRGVLIKNNKSKRFFVFLVEFGKETQFHNYCKNENLLIVTWLDSDEQLEKVEHKLKQN
ncbi:MAG: hypothetical protein CMM02_06385 [Rhodopirellula sp.]|nr:hypothetical protein [Rhodopirellula sp.]